MKGINVAAVALLILSACVPHFAQQPGRQSETRVPAIKSDRGGLFTNRLRILREELDKPAPDKKKLGMLFANLSVAAHAERTIDEALKLFEQAESESKLPADARVYYAKLLADKYDSYALQSSDDASLRSPAARFLSPALILFLQAYSDEAAKDTIDARRLADIGLLVVRVYGSLGREDDANQWLQSMVSVSALPESMRADIAYTVAVHFWKKSYDLTTSYTNQGQPLPDANVAQVRAWLNEAHSYINTTHSLDPKHANSWFYEKLIALEESAIETDPEQKKAIQRRAIEAQDRYIALINEERRSEGGRKKDSRDDEKPYASGLPSLNFSTVTLLAPPPPPPPPGWRPEKKP